jgi:hypothetical protein
MESLMRFVMVVLVLFLCSCAHNPDPWTSEQKLFFSTATALQVMDYTQTQYALRNPDRFYEINPIIDKAHDKWGAHGVTAYFAASLASRWVLVHYTPTQHRWLPLTLFNLMSALCVGNNYDIGVQLLNKPY